MIELPENIKALQAREQDLTRQVNDVRQELHSAGEDYVASLPPGTLIPLDPYDAKSRLAPLGALMERNGRRGRLKARWRHSGNGQIAPFICLLNKDGAPSKMPSVDYGLYDWEVVE